MTRDENGTVKRRRKKRRRKRAAALLALAGVFVAAMTGAAVLFARAAEHEEKKTITEATALSSAVYAEPAYVVDPYADCDYDVMNGYVERLSELYPELIKSFSIGISAEGRELTAFTLGTGDVQIILTGAIHGCEYFTADFLMYMADRYAFGYANDETIAGLSYRTLLDGVTFTIVPMLNPDGVNIALNGAAGALDSGAVSSMDLAGAGYSSWKSNANGVDLNRNFPFNWTGSVSSVAWPAARYYPGPYAASEPETRAVMALLESTDFAMLADFHICGEVIYWNDNSSPELTESMRASAERLMAVTGYADAGQEDVSDFGGFLSNYARDVYQRFAITVELATDSPYSAENFDVAVDDGVYMIGLVMADEAMNSAKAVGE